MWKLIKQDHRSGETMTVIFKAFRQGLTDIWREKRLLFLVYTVNLFFAYLLTLPVIMMFSEALTNTTAADKLLEKFDFTIVTNIFMHFGKGLNLPTIIWPLGIFYLLLNTFLAGGIIQLFVSRQKFNFSAFVHACQVYYMRFLKLFALSLFFILTIVVINSLLARLFEWITADATTERMPFIFFSGRLLIIIAMLIITNMFFDYAKIITIVNETARTVRAVELAWFFVSRRFIESTGLYKLYLGTAILSFFVYLVVESYLQVSTPWMVFVIFLWTQIYILVKIWIRLSFFAGQTALYYRSVPAGMSGQLMENSINKVTKQ